MPAWGVRTALTALRSFMAEKGSAGQVGGLEAPADVRKRLAKESRTWKCEACGKSNEAVMREWWDVCRDAGVDLKSEEDISLESLPEGMALEARDPNAPSNAVKKSESDAQKPTEAVSQQQQAPSTVSNISASSIPQPAPPASSPPRTSAPSSLRPPSHSPIPHIATPSAEAAQASAESVLTAADLAQAPNTSTPAHPRPLISGLHNAPLAAANAAMSQNPRPLTAVRDREREREQTVITIDRAIAGVFLALCLMVLKKIFFPAGAGGMTGASVDDFYLQRE